MAESLVTIRVSLELKERMKKAGINWSEELRKAIEAKLASDQRKKAKEELEKLLASVKPGFDSTRAIKEVRKHD
jgi:post-segregation antitoxin (ccd killing protein)